MTSQVHRSAVSGRRIKEQGIPNGMAQREYIDAAKELAERLKQPGVGAGREWNINLKDIGSHEEKLQGKSYTNSTTGEVLFTSVDGSKIVTYHPPARR
ncbi:hypothetical protein ACIPLC_26965 [Kitasatospora sp. NPDC086801]|uniref:hypothetical protein n=1 Tax=Kitasatospora sp. NPDC086801 TaxID=3364066 RepID=UPI0037F2A72D